MRMKVDALTLATLGRFIAAGVVDPLELTEEQKRDVAFAQNPDKHKPGNYNWRRMSEEDYANYLERKRKSAVIMPRVKELRIEKKMLQRELAATTGIKLHAYTGYERLRNALPEKYIAPLAKALGVTVDDLLKEE